MPLRITGFSSVALMITGLSTGAGGVPSNDADVLLLDAPSPDQFPPYFRGPKDSLMFSPAPLLVYEILNGGFIYLNKVPGLNGIEEEAFNDPQVRAVISNNL